MKQYLVTWVIDIEASSPEEAANLALEIQRDGDSEALAFTVKEQATGEETDVDLLHTLVTKSSLIKYIQEIISIYGSFSTAEVEADFSPAINVFGEHSLLVEEFYLDSCIAFEYVLGSCTGEYTYTYESLEREVIEQIFNLVKNWEESQKIEEDGRF